MIGTDVRRTAERLSAERRPFVAATVVRAERPTSARPGDSAVIHPDGTVEGFVGGACALSTVRMHALRVLETEEPLLLRIQPDGEEGEPAAGIAVATNPCLSGGALEIFLEPRLPAPLVRVVGDSPVAGFLRQLAGPVGFEVHAGQPVEGDDAVVVAALGHDDAAPLERALACGAGYVALVASRRRGAAVLEELRRRGADEAAVARVHTPAGLDIGARTHAEIALSILAEIVQARAVAVPDRTVVMPVVAAGAVDPVCGMFEPSGGVWQRLQHGGVEYAFCCGGCAERFAADPSRYVPAGAIPEGKEGR